MSSRRLIVSLTIVMLTQFFKKQLAPPKTMTLAGAVFEMKLEELAEKRRLLNPGAKYPVLEHPHFTSESFPGAVGSMSYHYRGTCAAA